MIVQVGDLHLDDTYPWSIGVGTAVVQHILTHPLNVSTTTWIFSGDLTEKSIVSGSVSTLLKQLLEGLVGRVYIVRGNHDIKRKNNIVSTPYDPYLTSTVSNVTDRTIETIDGLTVALLPHISSAQGGSVKDYEFGGPRAIQTPVDLLIGHFADTSQPAIFDNLIDISYVQATYISLGHIHNPIGDHYIGSVIPNKVSEAKRIRRLRTFEKTAAGVKMNELRLPKFSDYYDVEYPAPLPDTSSCQFPIFTIHNCSDEELARRLYGDIYIRKCIYDASADFEVFVQQQVDVGDDFITTDYKPLLTSWLTDIDASPEVREVALQYMTN